MHCCFKYNYILGGFVLDITLNVVCLLYQYNENTHINVIFLYRKETEAALT